MGMVPGGTGRNREFCSCRVDITGGISNEKMDILYDAQTSGGLLISVEVGKVERLLEQLHAKGVQQAAMVGEVIEDPKGRIVVS